MFYVVWVLLLAVVVTNDHTAKRSERRCKHCALPMQAGPSSISVPNLKRIALFVHKLLGSQKFEIGSRDPGHAHLGVVLYSIRRRGLSSISTKFEADSSFRSKVIRGV